MGLVAGQSTSLDVDLSLQMLDEFGLMTWLSEPINRGDNIDPDTGLVQTGGYLFDIEETEREPSKLASRIEIREGLVDLMVIDSHRKIPLIEVIRNLGTIDISRLHIDTERVRIALIYIDMRLRINLVQSIDNCHTGLLTETLIVDSILYYSPSAATSLVPSADYDFLQPALTRYGLLNDRDVPLDLWQSWLDGEVDMSCEEAWELLPEPEITPAVEMTVEPIPTKESQ